jgi:WD40 repeat protein
VKEYKLNTGDVNSLLYLPKQNYLIAGSRYSTIDVINLSEGTSIHTLTGHSNDVTSIISLNDETFASSCLGEIKIWSIKSDTSIQCIQTIVVHEYSDYPIVLYNLGSDFIISQSGHEFKIWDWKTYENECLRTYREDYPIIALTVTKNLDIITGTKDKFVNLWKVLE